MSDKATTPAGGAPALRCAILAVGDAASPAVDAAADRVLRHISGAGHTLQKRWTVPDEPGRIDDALIDAMRDAQVEVILCVGGSGVGRREFTYEVVARRFAKPMPAFESVFGALAFERLGGARALALRAIAGTMNGKLLVALPAHDGAIDLALERILLPDLAALTAEAKR